MLAQLTLPLDSTASTPEVLDNAPLAGAGDLLLINTTDQGDEAIAALDVATGEYRWVATVDRTPVGMVVVGDRVWLALQQPGLRQRLLAFDLATGEEVLDVRLPEGTSMLDDERSRRGPPTRPSSSCASEEPPEVEKMSVASSIGDVVGRNT